MIHSPFIKIPLTIDEDGSYVILDNSDEVVKKEQLVAKRESQNRVVIQQMFLVAVLNNIGFDIVLNKPHKRSTTTMQYFPISKISRGQQVIWDVEQEDLKDKSSKEKKTYLDTMTNNLMILLLKQNNIFLKERSTRKGTKEDYIQMKRIESIAIGNGVINLIQSNEFGKRIYSKIQNRMQKDGLTLYHFDKEITNLLYSSICLFSSIEPLFKQFIYSSYKYENSNSSCIYKNLI
ncbi:hypothetical protein EHI8A_092250 [Entamoeba histolytica HM-1:IMSS-B]|uniref:Uncharacterized protein n=6 Tax=Entamoeba histolytica TaxID=5759 RepID=C4M2R5_ENTH1|nr:hypothetical protein EHI_160970 [Entamoeba histolytica HM-1:IMSS]EMD45996.1 Hypothetical protein EHI5A_108080 [Entamoeba histolytica KU27]EMH74036.1 hypothetical protein EHI8A_092250 [Entamoeba histolytica HM-1:IMSS-B]EMS15094.1 hypothetical protein KM1_130820 [Entamoeba histolytica HM-3:IMSS]ENY64089.1 hypothetical protein EHI7A_072180 [Entamoeba histolytica HM-1:IMSS-A]GAT95576.1 hypothetical protein CL6EHI_160970 [Entamoeba histolytica]|eukprot:XP_649237.1 hypothetical protein EHI_160970 [Entamoeba histolytica HM-1:IMSS]